MKLDRRPLDIEIYMKGRDVWLKKEEDYIQLSKHIQMWETFNQKYIQDLSQEVTPENSQRNLVVVRKYF